MGAADGELVVDGKQQHFFGLEYFINGDGSKVMVPDLLDGKKIVIMYFGLDPAKVDWLPKERDFKEDFLTFYKNAKEEGIDDFECIFWSTDKEAEDCANYCKDMPFPHEEHGFIPSFEPAGRTVGDRLKARFAIPQLPWLMVLDNRGKILHAEGQSPMKREIGQSNTLLKMPVKEIFDMWRDKIDLSDTQRYM